VGLFLFLGVILVGLFKAYRLTKQMMQHDPDLALLGASLVACMLGTLFMIGTCSLILGYEKVFYILAALAGAYAHLGRSPQRNAAADGRVDQRLERR
jgi:hypothetical protein